MNLLSMAAQKKTATADGLGVNMDAIKSLA